MSETEQENPGTEPEPDHDDDDEAAAPPEPEQSPEAAAAADGSNEIMLKADKENQRYHRAIDRILGPDENRHECAACDGLGIVWGEQGAGANELPELAVAKDARPCEDCHAMGVVLTGSHHPGQETKPCADCGGRGWLNVVVPVPAPPTPLTPSAQSQQQLTGTWVPGRGFVPFGASDPIVADPSVAP